MAGSTPRPNPFQVRRSDTLDPTRSPPYPRITQFSACRRTMDEGPRGPAQPRAAQARRWRPRCRAERITWGPLGAPTRNALPCPPWPSTRRRIRFKQNAGSFDTLPWRLGGPGRPLRVALSPSGTGGRPATSLRRPAGSRRRGLLAPRWRRLPSSPPFPGLPWGGGARAMGCPGDMKPGREKSSPSSPGRQAGSSPWRLRRPGETSPRRPGVSASRQLRRLRLRVARSSLGSSPTLRSDDSPRPPGAMATGTPGPSSPHLTLKAHGGRCRSPEGEGGLPMRRIAVMGFEGRIGQDDHGHQPGGRGWPVADGELRVPAGRRR